MAKTSGQLSITPPSPAYRKEESFDEPAYNNHHEGFSRHESPYNTMTKTTISQMQHRGNRAMFAGHPQPVDFPQVRIQIQL